MNLPNFVQWLVEQETKKRERKADPAWHDSPVDISEAILAAIDGRLMAAELVWGPLVGSDPVED